MIRVFLLDEQEIFRHGLRNLLEQEEDIAVVGEAGLIADALARIPAVDPTVVVLDARLPDGSGIDVCRGVRAKNAAVAVVVLTSDDDDDALFAAIMAGADGFLLKQARAHDLVAVVRRVAAGQSFLDPVVTERVLARVRDGDPQAGPLDQLTPRESRILELIGEGMTNRQIAAEMFLAEKTVKNYVSRLLAKLGLNRRTQAAVLAARHHPGVRKPHRPPDTLGA